MYNRRHDCNCYDQRPELVDWEEAKTLIGNNYCGLPVDIKRPCFVTVQELEDAMEAQNEKIERLELQTADDIALKHDYELLLKASGEYANFGWVEYTLTDDTVIVPDADGFSFAGSNESYLDTKKLLTVDGQSVTLTYLDVKKVRAALPLKRAETAAYYYAGAFANMLNIEEADILFYGDGSEQLKKSFANDLFYCNENECKLNKLTLHVIGLKTEAGGAFYHAFGDDNCYDVYTQLKEVDIRLFDRDTDYVMSDAGFSFTRMFNCCPALEKLSDGSIIFPKTVDTPNSAIIFNEMFENCPLKSLPIGTQLPTGRTRNSSCYKNIFRDAKFIDEDGEITITNDGSYIITSFVDGMNLAIGASVNILSNDQVKD